MYSHTHSIKSITLLLIILSFSNTSLFGSETNQAVDLAVVKKWLPHYHSQLQLIFEYDSEMNGKNVPSSEQMHRAIDKAGPTIALIEAQIAYEDEPRTIGGYNPYKWKTWLGRYESNPGRFIFDVDKEKRWERTTNRFGSFKSPSSEYGLSFGEGDLVINPDLTSGSAKNKTFSDNPNGSVLIGQAGDFVVKSLRIYQVSNKTDAVAADHPIPQPRIYYNTPTPNPVPDESIYLLEALLGLLAIALYRTKTRKN